MSAPEPDRLIRDVEVARQLSVSRAQVWAMVNDGKLPQPVRLSAKMTRWRESEIQKLIRQASSVA